MKPHFFLVSVILPINFVNSAQSDIKRRNLFVAVVMILKNMKPKEPTIQMNSNYRTPLPNQLTFGLLPHTETMKKIYNLLFFNNLVHLTIIMNFCNTSKLFANKGDFKFVKLKEKQCRLR